MASATNLSRQMDPRASEQVGAATLTDASTSLWRTLDELLETAELDGIIAHKLGPLAANRLRRLGQPLPPELRAEERAAALANALALPLIERIRASSNGPLLLFKGPEVARLYPGRARRFVDLDLLAANAEGVHGALIAHGFVEGSDDPDEVYVGHAHLRELKWPTMWLKIEVHSRIHWPRGVGEPPLRTLLEAAVPSSLGIDGISALSPVHHVLVLAVHAWVHEPFATLRDLVDIAAAMEGLDVSEVERTAQAWGIQRLWRTTRQAIDALFYGGNRTLPLRTWARSLPAVRGKSVLENHLGRWLHPYWELPPAPAARRMAETLLDDLRPAPGELLREKLLRISRAVRNPRGRADAS
jgi:hypothetical protein